MFKSKAKRYLGLAAGFCCLLVFAHAGGFRFAALPAAQAGLFSSELEVFEEVLDLVSKNYVYPPDYARIFQSAIAEIVKVAGKDKLSLEETGAGSALVAGGKRLAFRLSADEDDDFKTLKKICRFVNDELKGNPAAKAVEMAGVTGMMNALDAYSQFLDKDMFERSISDTEGQYGGLGLVITMRDLRLTVVRAMRNSPAGRAGLGAGDIIANVDGKEIKGMQIEELATMLRGYPNTQVTLTVIHPGGKEPQSYTLTREIIVVDAVEYKKTGDDTGYIRVAGFSKQTNDQLEEALAAAKKDKVGFAILDLRGNPGGLLDQSVRVASHFLGHGQLVVYTQGRKKNDRREYLSVYKESWNARLPMVVLIDRHSASASEIVAGALRDSGRAMIIGDTSFGKGSVQTIFRIRDNAGIRLTTSKYYTPSGIDITEQGIVPEVKIVDDELAELEKELPPQHPLSKRKARAESPIVLKKTDVIKYLRGKGVEVTKESDPAVLFAHAVVRGATAVNTLNAFSRAKEIASGIRY